MGKLRIVTGSLTRPMPQYASAAGEGISVLDVVGGAIVRRQVDGGFDDLAWVLASEDGKQVFATHEEAGADQSRIAAFRHDAATGGLIHLGSHGTGGCEACHACLSLDGRHLVVANYNGEAFLGLRDGALAVFPVTPNGLGPASAMVTFHGSGPNPNRQARAHAHCVRPRPGTDLLYAADLGSDRLRVFALSADGGVSERPYCDVPFQPGDGPRHLVFTSDGHWLLTVCELTPKVTCHRIDAAGRAHLTDTFTIQAAQGTITQPSGITLAGDDATIYVGLRVAHEILGLHLTAEGQLRQILRVSSGGETPRDLILTADGRKLAVANQDSSAITLFDRDPANGALTGAQYHPVGTPMTLTLLPSP